MSELTREYFDGEMEKVHQKIDGVKEDMFEIKTKNDLQDYKIEEGKKDINNVGGKLEIAIVSFSKAVEKLDNKKANKITLYAFSTFLGLLITMLAVIKLFFKG